MFKTIRKFIKCARQKLFALRVQNEIEGKVFPHLRREKDNGYPFDSKEKLAEENMREYLAIDSLLAFVELTVSKMPEAEGEALKHIMHRDLSKLLWKYQLFASDRIQPDEWEARFTARAAV